MSNERANGHARPLTELQEEYRRLRLEAKVQQLKLAKEEILSTRASLQESHWGLWDWAQGPDAWMRARMGTAQQTDAFLPPATPSDRRHGGYWPFWRTELERMLLLQNSRVCAQTNGYAQGLIDNLINYLLGKGGSYKVICKELQKPPKVDEDDKPAPAPQPAPAGAPPGQPPAVAPVPEPEPDPRVMRRHRQLEKLVEFYQEFVNEFLSKNQWNATPPDIRVRVITETKERETVRRGFVDGEVFLWFHECDDGVAEMSFIDPACICNPPGAVELDGWSHGIRHQMQPYEDVTKTLAYCYYHSDPETANELWDEIPAAEVLNLRGGRTFSDVTRGIPLLSYDVRDGVSRASMLQRYLSVAAKVRAATAEIWKHANASQTQIASLVQTMPGRMVINPANGQPMQLTELPPGSTRRVPEGQEPVNPPPATGVSEHMDILGGDIKLAAAATCFPGFFVSADMTDGNYSNLETATGPVVRAGEANQEMFRAVFSLTLCIAAHLAVKAGRLPREAVELCEIQVELPAVLHRNSLEKTQENKILMDAELKSGQTIQMELGLDTETEGANVAEWKKKHAPPAAPGGMPGQPAPPGTEAPPAPPGGPQPAPEQEQQATEDQQIDLEAVLSDKQGQQPVTESIGSLIDLEFEAVLMEQAGTLPAGLSPGFTGLAPPDAAGRRYYYEKGVRKKKPQETGEPKKHSLAKLQQMPAPDLRQHLDQLPPGQFQKMRQDLGSKAPRASIIAWLQKHGHTEELSPADQVRRDIAKMPLEQLRQMRNELGAKVSAGVVKKWMDEHKEKVKADFSDKAKWKKPNLENEYEEISRVAEQNGFDRQEVNDAVESGKLEELPDDIWGQLQGSKSTSAEQAKQVFDENEMGKRHDYQRIERGMEEGKELPAPIILKKPDGSYELVAGGTRLVACRMHGVRPQVWIGEMPPAAPLPPMDDSDDYGDKKPQEEPSEPANGGTGKPADARSPEERGPEMAPTTGGAADKANAGGGDAGDKPAGEGTAHYVPPEPEKLLPREAKHIDRVNKSLDRFTNLFRSHGQHQVAEWMDKLRQHINTVGAQAALDSLGPEVTDSGAGEVQYEGTAFDNEHTAHFVEQYLNRAGIIPVEVPTADPNKPVISSFTPSNENTLNRQGPGDFTPSDPTLANKLEEAKHLPGLEKSEDINKLMGKPITHLTPEVTAKMDEHYGPGKWIIKSYGPEGFAGFGVYFPQRAQQIKQDAQNTLWSAGEQLAKYGFSLHRNKAGKVVGLKHSGGDRYDFGSKRYTDTIHGDARHWGDKAAAVAGNEHGAELPGEKFKNGGAIFMAQPAFDVVGVSDADRAAGKTWEGNREARVHIVTRNGKAEIIPHSTWIKGEHLPVVFEDDETKAMAKAAMEAIAALPESERSGQTYAPDVVRKKNDDGSTGYGIVEANPSAYGGGSGYLNDNPMIIDSYVSAITGREPAHVKFIRKLLSSRKEKVQESWDAEKHPRGHQGNAGQFGSGMPVPAPPTAMPQVVPRPPLPKPDTGKHFHTDLTKQPDRPPPGASVKDLEVKHVGKAEEPAIDTSMPKALISYAAELGLKDPAKEEDPDVARSENNKKTFEKLKAIRPTGWGEPKKGKGYSGPSIAIEGTGFSISVGISAPFVVYPIRDHNKTMGKQFKTIEAAVNFVEGAYARGVLDGGRLPPEGSPLHEILKRVGQPSDEMKAEAKKQNREVLPTGQMTPPGHSVCAKCAGYGNLAHFGHVAEGVCFRCNGAGFVKDRHALKESKDDDALLEDYRETDHPRDDHGHWVKKGDIAAAKKDPAKADALRASVTNPEQRARLDVQLSSKPLDPGKKPTAKTNKKVEDSPQKTKKPAAVRSAMTAAQYEAGAPAVVVDGVETVPAKPAKIILANGQPAPPHITAAMVGQNWTDVKVSLDPEGMVRATGFSIDKHGKTVAETTYSDRWNEGADARKFSRIHDALHQKEVLAAQIQQGRADPKKQDSADAAWLMMVQGTRPGSEKDNKGVGKLFGHKLTPANFRPVWLESVAPVAGKPQPPIIHEDDDKDPFVKEKKADDGKPVLAMRVAGEDALVKDKKAIAEIKRRIKDGDDLEDSGYWLKSHGATTLEGRNVVVTGAGVVLRFMGKESVWHEHYIRDPKLAAMLKARKHAAGDRGQLFPRTNDTKAAAYVSSLDGGKFTPKDLRTMRGTEMAVKEVARRDAPKTQKELKKAIMEIGGIVSGVLGNEAQQAVDTYISPVVWSGWLNQLKGS